MESDSQSLCLLEGTPAGALPTGPQSPLWRAVWNSSFLTLQSHILLHSLKFLRTPKTVCKGSSYIFTLKTKTEKSQIFLSNCMLTIIWGPRVALVYVFVIVVTPSHRVACVRAGFPHWLLRLVPCDASKKNSIVCLEGKRQKRTNPFLVLLGK